MKIYTKTGDNGYTTLNHKRVSKSSFLINVIGELDELNVLIGSCTVLLENNKTFIKDQEFLIALQNNIFALNAFLSGYATSFNTNQVVKKLETEIDKLILAIKPIRNFVLPGGSNEVININLARVKTRKVERKLVQLANDKEQKELALSVLPFINRLSDYFFIFALYVAEKQGIYLKKWVIKNT